MKYTNYIFDLYGTLVDIHTNEKKIDLWRKFANVLAMFGAEYEPKELRTCYKEMVKEEQDRLLKRYLEQGKKVRLSDIEIKLEFVFWRLLWQKGVQRDVSEVHDLAVFFRALSLEKLTLFDGAKELLKNLKQAEKKIYLLSNAQRIFTEPEMKRLGIYDLFDGILYSSDTGFQKPSPYFYEELFVHFPLQKEESVMIGNDRFADAGGAEQFGIDSMYIETEQSTPFTGSLPKNCRKISSLAEVIA